MSRRININPQQECQPQGDQDPDDGFEAVRVRGAKAQKLPVGEVEIHLESTASFDRPTVPATAVIGRGTDVRQRAGESQWAGTPAG